eukprot:2183788-Rhodomonas_salina.7
MLGQYFKKPRLIVHRTLGQYCHARRLISAQKMRMPEIRDSGFGIRDSGFGIRHTAHSIVKLIADSVADSAPGPCRVTLILVHE